MLNRRSTTYEYKMISSFYDNYVKHHNYLKIKSIVLVNYFKTDEETNLIHKFHQFLVLMLIEPRISLIDTLNSNFQFVFKVNLSFDIYNQIKEINNSETLNDIEKSLRFLELSMVTQDQFSSFCLFVLGGIFLNYYYKDYIVIPVYLFDKLGTITHDYEIRDVYYKSVIEQTLKFHDDKLKDKIVGKYLDSRNELVKLGIDELWLFGSIVDGTYHDQSDIDVVIKMKDGYDFYEASNYIRIFNNKHFDKKSDILENDDFDNLNQGLAKIRIL